MELSAEIIVRSVMSNAQKELEDGHGSSTDYDSIMSSPLELHNLVLLMWVCNYEGEAIEPKLFTQNNIRELCLNTKCHCDPYDIKIMSDYEVCLMFKKNVTFGSVARDLMSVEDCMGIPVVITVIILGRNKVRAILYVRERHRRTLKGKIQEDKELEKKLGQIAREKGKLEKDMQEYYGKQRFGEIGREFD